MAVWGLIVPTHTHRATVSPLTKSTLLVIQSYSQDSVSLCDNGGPDGSQWSSVYRMSAALKSTVDFV